MINRLKLTSKLFLQAGLFASFLAMSGNIPLFGDEPRTDANSLFEQSVRPMLLGHCIKCHGPGKSESGLRLDSRQAMLKGGDSGPAISLKSPDESLILKALRHEDGLEMPPLKKRPDAEVNAIHDWISRGAVWPDEILVTIENGPKIRSGTITEEEKRHWAYQPIQDHEPPPSPDDKPQSAIDRFINARIKAADLQKVELTGKGQWLRRATFDLTGLPPRPQELEEFLNDQSEAAYARVINRLLDSPAYGERWGRHWLDVVRYADTAGETADYPTPLSYKYRNWVIESFNRDTPYDEFIRNQIAGDIYARHLVKRVEASGQKTLSDETLSQYEKLMTATGFIAISRRFGFDVENYHYLTIQDTIDVVGQAMMGLTLGCARCHDHKYDPINMTDYYSWYGIFQSTRYSFPGSEEKKRPYDLYPAIPERLANQRTAAFEAEVSALEKELSALDEKVRIFSQEIQKQTGYADYFGFEQGIISQPPPKPYNSLASANVSESAQSPFRNVFAFGSRGLSFPSNSENNAFGRTLPRVYKPDSDPILFYNIDFRNSADASGDGAYRFYVGHGPGQSGALEMAASNRHFLIKNGQNYEPVVELKTGQWYNVQVRLDLVSKTFEGAISDTNGQTTRFENKAFTTGWDGVVDYTFVDRYGPGSGPTPAHDVDNLCLDTKPFAAVTAEGIRNREKADVNSELSVKLAKVQKLQADRDSISTQIQTLKKDGPIPSADRIYGAIEQEKPADSVIQLRGEPNRPGKVAPRRNLEILGGEPLTANSGSGRSELADWLTRDENPLMARVMVNRIWQNHFGVGLVATENDFGSRGEFPSHPELLDWLACRFRESGYSVKAMHRLIMNTDAYRRSSRFLAKSAEKDPEARLLWRFRPRRLSAEEIRDSMLAVGGNLDTTMGQQHPFPPEESWGFSQHSPYYAVYESSRRSVYLMQQRLKRHPFLGLFDSADTNASTPHRDMTTVPTQALFLMNNPFVHEQSERLASRLLEDQDETAESRIERAFLIALSRRPGKDEMADSQEFMNRYQKAVTQLNPAEPKANFRAWSAFARNLITRNEFLFVD